MSGRPVAAVVLLALTMAHAWEHVDGINTINLEMEIARGVPCGAIMVV